MKEEHEVFERKAELKDQQMKMMGWEMKNRDIKIKQIEGNDTEQEMNRSFMQTLKEKEQQIEMLKRMWRKEK